MGLGGCVQVWNTLRHRVCQGPAWGHGPYPFEWTLWLAASDSLGVSGMGSTRRRFTEEYKGQAVAFVLEGNRSVADVARNIGVHEMTLGNG